MNPPPPPPPRRRPAADPIAIGSLVAAVLALFTCMPLLAGLAGVGGFVAFRRARRNGAPVKLPAIALAITGAAFLLQVGITVLATEWLAPAMQKRTNEAIRAAIEGDASGALPAAAGLGSLSQPLDAPAPEAFPRFAAEVRDRLGALRSLSTLGEEPGGSPLAPTASMALTLEFERGTCTGSAKVQWVPASDASAPEWMPRVRVLEVEVSLPGGGTASLRPEAAAPGR